MHLSLSITTNYFCSTYDSLSKIHWFDECQFQKNALSNTEDPVQSLVWYYKLFYKLTSKYFLLLLPIVYICIFELAMFINIWVNNFRCTPLTAGGNTYIHLGFSAFCAGGFVFLLCVDLIISAF